MLVLAKDRYHLIANKLKLVKKVNIPITYITIISKKKSKAQINLTLNRRIELPIINILPHVKKNDLLIIM